MNRKRKSINASLDQIGEGSTASSGSQNSQKDASSREEAEEETEKNTEKETENCFSIIAGYCVSSITSEAFQDIREI